MITKLRIKNFKCLQDTQDLEIRPLTILVGPNSSGKSAVLKMLLMLRQTLDSSDPSSPLTTSGNLIKGGTYPDFIFNGEKKRDLEVTLTFENPNRSKKKPDSLQELSLTAIYTYNPRNAQIKLKKSDIRTDKATQTIKLAPSGRRYTVEITYTEKGKIQRYNIDKFPIRPIKFFDFVIRTRTKKPPKELMETLSKSETFIFRYIISQELLNVFYLGPLRDHPKRAYFPSGEAPQDVGIRGERAVDVLWFSEQNDQKIRRLTSKMQKWFQEFGFSKDICLERLSKGSSPIYQVAITDRNTDFKANISDVGFGISQALPIIVESFYAPSGSLILIEQPEIHLHPRAQTTLGDLFIDAIREKDRRFIIETHSEHMLARIRRRIAENKLDKSEIAIYYFNPTPAGTQISEITLNEYGQYLSFPDGFFVEDFDETFEHLKAIREAQVKQAGENHGMDDRH
jgi:predicted ATPase